MQIVIIPKTQYQFDGRANSTQEITILNALPFEFASGVLTARLHFQNGWKATATLVVAVQNIQIPPEEPHAFFMPSSGTADLASVTIVTSDNPPQLYNASFSNPGTHLRVMIRWLQGATAATAQQTAAIGIDLSGRQP